MPTTKLTSELITAAIEGYQTQRSRIDAQIAQLRAMLSGGPAASDAAGKAPARKRKISAAARHRMAMAQRARWARIKAGAAQGAAQTSAAKKPRISAAGLKRIIAANKKRWALKRAEAGKAQAAAKKAAKEA